MHTTWCFLLFRDQPNSGMLTDTNDRRRKIEVNSTNFNCDWISLVRSNHGHRWANRNILGDAQKDRNSCDLRVFDRTDGKCCCVLSEWDILLQPKLDAPLVRPSGNYTSCHESRNADN